jgi:hypothetical protein
MHHHLRVGVPEAEPCLPPVANTSVPQSNKSRAIIKTLFFISFLLKKNKTGLKTRYKYNYIVSRNHKNYSSTVVIAEREYKISND